MTSRTCPNCNSRLGHFDSYFCSSCGAELPDDISLSPTNHLRVVGVSVVDTNLKKVWDSLKQVFEQVSNAVSIREVLLLIMFFVFLGLPVFLGIKKYGSELSLVGRKEEAPPVDHVEIGGIDVEENFKSNVFGANFVTEYIPSEIDVYLEAHDFQKFSFLVGVTDDEFLNLAKDLSTSMDSHFGLFLKEYDGEMKWAFVLFPFETYYEETVDFDEYERYYVGEVDNSLVVTNQEDILDLVESSKEGLTKNLDLNSNFVSYKASLPKSGQFLVVSLTEAGQEYLEDLQQLDLPDEFEVLLDRYLSQDSESIVFN
jgi:hypothetical protein